MKKVERKDIIVYRQMVPIATMAKDPVFGGGTVKGMVTSEDVNKLFVYIEELESRLQSPDQEPLTDTYQQIQNDAWIEWGGGDSPIKPGETVQFKMRGGEENIASHGLLDWSHEGLDDDIIAYRVIEGL